MVAPPLVVGIGNPDRGDDAIGLRVARRLRERVPKTIEVVETDGEPTRLLDLLAERTEVWLIDAAVSGAEPGTIRRFDAAAGPLPVRLGGPSSHGLGAAEAIELARTLAALPSCCLVFTIEGAAFETGGPLSPEVEAAGEALARRLAGELGNRHPGA